MATSSSFCLIDASSNSLTVSWTATPSAAHYVLQYRKAGRANEGDDQQQQSFETLSDKLTTPQARKRNLTDARRSWFRLSGGGLHGDK